MEDHRFREDLGLTTTTAAALSSSSPTSPTLPLPGKKIQSYSQQLNRSKPNLPDNLRNHSLEEDKFSFNGGFAGFGSVNNGGQEYKTRFEEDEDKFSFNGGFAGFGSVNNGGQEYKTRFEEDAQEEQIPSRTSSTNSNNNTNISLVHQNSQTQPLSEFIGNGGGNGIFTVPIRAAIPPDRPPSLELRPRPSRDTQLGLFLRVVGCSDEHLWAGHECGMRFWKFEEMYLGGGGLDVRRGDESASPFYESEVGISPIFCMAMGMSSGIVWSGHKDGKIRLWEMDQCLDGTPFKESLVWRAHKGPILSLASSSYGDLWSGCEGGVVKVWPWESIEQSFSLKNDEINMASLLVEKSFIDLRAQVTVNGVCALSHTDVHFILADNSRGKVWSAGYQSFALWDARTRELVKVFNIDGQVSRADKPPARDPCVEDDTKTKVSSSSKKDKSQNSLNFLQRSRNALLGAADAVRRVAGKGAFGDDHRTEAMVLTGDGMIWTGCSNGLLVQWDGNGTRLRDFNHHPFSVKCLCAFGARMWVGYVTGTIQVLNLDGSVLGEWIAHNSPIIDMAVGAGYVFTLANHGGIRGWNITSPGPLDDMLRSEVANKESLYTQVEKLNLMVGTWNVGQGKASHDSLIMWLGSAAEDASIIVVGLQEVEMGAGFLAISAARETVGIEGTSIGQWWLDTLGKSLDEGSTFERIGSRQLAGLLIALWVRKNLRPHIGDIDVAAVPCGLGHAIGNKGAVGLRIRVYDRVMCFVNCHLAAHLEAVNKRNADFNHIYRTMSFNKPNQINASSASNSPATELLQVTNAVGIHSEDRKPELSEADLVVFLGDLNYRLDGISYEEAKDFISQRSFDWLKEKDQLRAAMKAAKVFQGMREGYIAFPPTYKFQKHEAGLGGYDASEKKRIPAWCDRVLYRDNRLSSETQCCLDCPIVSSIMQYDACMDVTDSDHKPVRCIFSVEVASIDESARRQEFGCIMEFHGKKLQEYVSDVPETTVSTNDVIIQNRDQYVLQLSNICRQNEAIFDIICEDQSTIKENGETHKHHLQIGFPRWLQINPAAGVIKPGEAFDISVAQEEFHTRAEYVDGVPQNWWCEDSRDKTVNLTVRVRGNCSTTTKSHRVHVCHSFTATGMPVKSKANLQSRSLPEKRESETGQSKAGIVQSKTLPHLPSASEDDMKGAKNYGVESMTLMQHLTSSFDAADPQQNLPLVEETSKSKSRKKKIKGIKSKSETKSKEGKSKNGVPRHNGGDVKSKTPQLSDLKNLSVNSYSSDTQHGLRSPPTEENSKNGAQRSNSRGNQSKSLQQQLESQDIDCTSVVGGTEHNLPARSTKENLKTGAKDDRAGRTKKQAPEQPDAPTSEGMNKCGDRDKNVREVQPKMLHQPESQHLSRDTDGSQDTMHISSIMGKSKSGAEQINAQVMLEKTPVQSDTQTVSCSSVADGTKKSSQTPSVEEKSEKGEPEDKDKRNQQKTLEQPKSQQQKLSTTRKNDDGESKSKALLLESQQLDLPNVVNPFFDAADTLHPTSVRTKSKNTAQKDNASEIQPKPLQHPDSKHPSGSSDRQNSKKGNCENELQHPSHISDADQRLNIQSVEERDRKGVREGNARENQSMERKSKSGAEKNGYSDAAEPEHSSHTLPTRREDSTETLPQTDLEQPSCHSSDAENRKSKLKSPPLIVERNRSSDREDNAKGNQTKLLQPADTEHRLVSPLIDEKGKKDKDARSRKEKSKNKGDAVDKKSKSKTPLVTEKRTSSDREEQSKHRPDEKTSFQQPYPESLNPFSDASDIEHRGTLTQPKPIQIPDPQTLNPFADSTAADSPQSMHSLSKKEKNKSARKQQESAANSPRCLHSPSKKEAPSIEEKIKTRARKLFLP